VAVAASNARGETESGLLPLRVVQNQLLDESGKHVHLTGVNRSGTEYACIQGWGIFDGPSDDASVAAIASWGSNAVRIGLNEDCWLGVNQVPQQYSGASYIRAITGYVQLLHSHGIYAVLALMWAAPGDNKATWQEAMADADHALAFWVSVAATFRDDKTTLFELYGEPSWISWPCWADGCDYSDKYGTWRTAGMRQMLNSVRGAGAHNVVLVSGNDYANDLGSWLAYAPQDADHQLVASFHLYGNNTCGDVPCWDSSVKEVAKRVPLVTAELGERADGSSCGHEFVDRYLGYARSNGLSYLAWTWNTWNPCSVLIRDFDGTPTPFGAAYRSQLQSGRPFATLPYAESWPSRPLFEIPRELRHERILFGFAIIFGLGVLTGGAWFRFRRRRAPA